MSTALRELETAQAALAPPLAAQQAAAAAVASADREIAEAQAELDRIGDEEQAAGADAAAAIRAGRRIPLSDQFAGRRSTAVSRLNVAEAAKRVLASDSDQTTKAVAEARGRLAAAVGVVLSQHAAEVARAGAEALEGAVRALRTLSAIEASGVRQFDPAVLEVFRQLMAVEAVGPPWLPAKAVAWANDWRTYRAALEADPAARPPNYPE